MTDEEMNDLVDHIKSVLNAEEIRSALWYITEIAGLDIDLRCYSADDIRSSLELANWRKK